MLLVVVSDSTYVKVSGNLWPELGFVNGRYRESG